MSRRLTNMIREQIAFAVLVHRFREPVDALIAERAAFAEEIYNDVYRKADREKMAALPKGWLPETNGINVQFGTDGRRYENLPFSGFFFSNVSSVRTPPDNKRVERRAFSKNVHGCVKVYDADHRLAKKHADLESRYGELKASYEAAKRQVEAAIASVSTVTKLIEMWPEVEPFTRSFSDVQANLPAVPTKQLNELLDLPVAA